VVTAVIDNLEKKGYRFISADEMFNKVSEKSLSKSTPPRPRRRFERDRPMNPFQQPRADLKALGLLTLLMLVIALPFVRRAYFVDDYYFVTMARGSCSIPCALMISFRMTPVSLMSPGNAANARAW